MDFNCLVLIYLERMSRESVDCFSRGNAVFILTFSGRNRVSFVVNRIFSRVPV